MRAARLVFAFSVVLGACVAHGSNAPAPAHAAPIPPPAGNVTFTATQGDRAACHPGQNCQLACPYGGCDVECEPGATCQASCDGGGCAQTCPAGATCEFSCDGGGCEQTCTQGTCAMTCDGGGCEQVGGATSPDDRDRDHHDDGDDQD